MLIKRCPNLEHLTIDRHSPDAPVDAHGLLRGHWPNLHSLLIGDVVLDWHIGLNPSLGKAEMEDTVLVVETMRSGPSHAGKGRHCRTWRNGCGVQCSDPKVTRRVPYMMMIWVYFLSSLMLYI
jgi:hypothetical protein